MTIREAATALRARKISCLELAEECLGQIDKANAKLNAFITVTRDSALVRARELDRELAEGKDRGPLHGIPIAHKDILYTEGVRTTCGSKLFADLVPDRDAVVVQKLDRAGAVMLGKTGLHELAYGITSDNPHFGTIRNPADPGCIPGGSSGGSGVAVATGMAMMATGTDTGGSIRIPASFCGVAGIKPTYGIVDRAGVHPLGLSLDHVGPLARTVDDCAIALEAMRDSRRRIPAPKNIKTIRAGLPGNYYFDQVEHEVREAVLHSARIAEGLGVRIVPVRVPDVNALNAVARVILLAEATAVNERRLDRRDDFGADVLALLDQGRLVPAPDYVNAQRLRKKLVADFRKLFESIDCLLTPATPIVAPRIGQKQIELDGEAHDTRFAATRFARGINALGFPALSIPCGKNPAGLPVGLQIVGRPYEDDLVLFLGAALESALPA